MTPLTDQVLALLDDTRSSDAWLDLAERAFVDTVGVLVAGSTDPAVARVAGLVDETSGPVVALATGARMSGRSAALLDGTAAHALDFDDVDDALIAHPSAVLVPALIAAGQSLDVSGRAMLHAYRVGLETARVVAGALDVQGHYAAGWHSTGTVGTVAAAAALAHLHGLDPLRTRHALGIAGSLAGGSRQNFGTMTKPLHAGAAASNALTAARLAVGGFTADPGQLDGPLGFLALHRPPSAPPAGPVELAPGVPDGLNLKLFACCYATHTAIEAALGLDRRDTTQVASVDVVMQPGGSAPLIHHRPADGTQAKFSVEYAVAVALVDGAVTLASFDDDRVRRDDVQTLLRRVDVAEAPGAGASDDSPWRVDLHVRYTDGTSATATVVDPVGHATRPLTEEQLRAKAEDCFGVLVGDPDRRLAVGAAYDALRGLRDQPSVRAVVDLVVAARPAATATAANR